MAKRVPCFRVLCCPFAALFSARLARSAIRHYSCLLFSANLPARFSGTTTTTPTINSSRTPASRVFSDRSTRVLRRSHRKEGDCLAPRPHLSLSKEGDYLVPLLRSHNKERDYLVLPPLRSHSKEEEYSALHQPLSHSSRELVFSVRQTRVLQILRRSKAAGYLVALQRLSRLVEDNLVLRNLNSRAGFSDLPCSRSNSRLPVCFKVSSSSSSLSKEVVFSSAA